MRTALACLLAVGALPAQESRAWLYEDLAAVDRERSEVACRKLCLASTPELERDRLLAMAKGPGPGADSARRVLVRHGLAAPPPRLAEAGLDELFAKCLGTDEPALRARRTLLWCVGPLPSELFLRIPATARIPWLDLLRERPRAEASLLVSTVLETAPKSESLARLSAIAALPSRSVGREHTIEIVNGLLSGDAALFAIASEAAQRLVPAVADGILTQIVRDERSMARPLPLLLTVGARATVHGESEILDFALRTAEPEVRRELVGWLDARSSVELAQRVASALDGEIPMRLEFLDRAGAHLTGAGRIARVTGYLKSEDASERVAAFEALLRARRFVPELVGFAESEPQLRRDRLRRILALPAAEVPVQVWKRLLADADLTVVEAACRGVAQEQTLQAVQSELLALLHHTDAEVAQAGREALLMHAEDRTARLALESATRDEDWLVALPCLSAKPRPFAEAMLERRLRDLDASGAAFPEANALQEAILVELTRLGSATARERVLKGMTTLSITALRQARQALAMGMRPVEADALLALVADPTLGKQPQRRCLLLQILAARPELVDVKKLLAVRSSDPDAETRLEALRLLLLTAGGESVRARLQPYLMGRLPGDDDVLDEIYEYLGAFALPLADQGIEAVAQMLLLAPLGDPRAEIMATRVRFGGEPDAPFPEQTMLVALLARSEAAAVGRGFAAVARQVREHPSAYALSRSRLLALLALLGSHADLLRCAGAPVAELLLHAPDADEAGVGLAHLVIGEAAEARGDHAQAAVHLTQALEHFAERPLPARLEGRFLGDRDVAAEIHRIAALGARAHLAAARAAHAALDPAKRERELEIAKSLAVGDQASVLAVAKTRQELSQ